MGGPLSLAPQKEENVITETLIRQCIQVVYSAAVSLWHQPSYLSLICVLDWKPKETTKGRGTE